LVLACGGGTPPAFAPTDGGASGDAKSYTAWAVAQGTVTAFALDPASLARGSQLGTATTAADGSWSLALNAGGGSLTILLAVSSGAYTEPTTGTPIVLDEAHQLTAILPPGSWHAGDKLGGVVVSPISHLAAQLAVYYAGHGMAGSDAIAKASRLLNGHFGGLDWASVQPIDATSAAAAGLQLNDQLKAGLLLAGISQEARNAAELHGLTPGAALNSLSLVTALAQDLAGNGYFDGLGGGDAQLSVPPGSASSYSLDGQTVRATLAQALLAFVSSAKNASKVTTADVQPLVSGIAGDASADLFRSSGPVNVTPPAIAFLQPVAATTVRGSTTVEVTATAAAGTMSTFTFTAPDVLKGVTASSESGGTVLHLRTPFDVSALPDGPVSIAVVAKDSSGNVAGQSLSITVANHGPSVSVVSPSRSQAVKGTVTIIATANSIGGSTVTGLALLNPPLGAGPNALPAADALSINWDTSKALEGPYTLHFRATDSAGGQTNLDVPVVVDNVPFGVIHVALAVGGQPIQNAFVHAYAVSDSNGQVDPTVGIAGELGPAAVTDKNGLATITLNTENRAGPIQLVAGGAALSFIDPSDQLTPVTVPQTFQFTSFIGHFVDGTAISAPITEWTTLADIAALAYVGGQNRLHPGTHPLSAALAFSDPLFSSHITSTQWDLRSTLPASLTSGAQQTLVDVTYAAMPGIGLNQLARDLAVSANVGTQALNSITLIQLLEQDLAADGQLDGLGAAGAQLLTPGNPRQGLDANTLRYSLSKALDEWFASSNNKSGIDEHTTLLNSGSLDIIATDTSDLFGSQAAQPFDNRPPVVTFAGTSFVGADGQTYSPVGAARYVAGALTLVVNASDSPAGLQSIAVSVNGSPTSAGAGSSLPSKFVAVINTATLPDGPLDVSVSAVDNYGNRGTTSTTFQVDNTPPLQTITGPAEAQATKGGSDVHVLASASDAGSGLRSFVATGLTGFLDTDTTAGGLVGNWDSSAAAEGTLHYAFIACDNVGNCSSSPRTLLVDRTPPTVALVTPTNTVYQQPSSITVSATAADSVSGVAAVCARVTTTGGPELCGSLTAGTWTVPVVNLKGGDSNTIAIYAKDYAGNSGFGSSTAGAQRNVNVIVDSAPPVPTQSQGLVSYCDETGLRAASAGGRVTMPPQYSCVNPTLLAVDTNASGSVLPVYKTITRLTWGSTPPTADQIKNATTTFNVPAVFIAVPFVVGKEAPIDSVSFTATLSGGGSGSATGSLTQTSEGLWVLPIMADVIPPLASVSGTATVRVGFTATDRAGNSNSSPYPIQFQFALVAPPLGAYEDTSFGSSNPTAAAHYTLGSQTYPTLFQPFQPGGPLAPEGPRFVRYVLENPANVPVSATIALTQGDGTHTSGYGARETWVDSFLGPPYGSESFSEQSGAAQCPGLSIDPCPGNDVLYANMAGAGYVCGSIPTNGGSEILTPASLALTLSAYALTGGSEGAAQVSSNGGVVVPAAVGSTPGRLAIYLARGPNAIRSAALSEALNWDGATSRYENFVGHFLTSQSRNVCYEDRDAGVFLFGVDYQKQDFSMYLSSASSVIAGTWSATSSGLVPGTSNVVGASRTLVAAQSFSRTINH